MFKNANQQLTLQFTTLACVCSFLAAACTDDEVSCPRIQWGAELAVGETVPNWTLKGYVDTDGDHRVEQHEVEFTMEDIHCTGKRALVLSIAEVQWQNSLNWFEQLSTVTDDIHQAEGLILAIYFGNIVQPTEFAYYRIIEYMDGDYISGVKPVQDLEFAPLTVVIDLKTMRVIGMDEKNAPLSPAEIVDHVQQIGTPEQ